MVRNFLILIALTLVGSTSARTASFVPRFAAANTALAVPRGGDHLDPLATAKLGTILAGSHAALTLMSPSRMADVYGTKSSPMTDYLAQWQGSIVLSFCLLAWNLVVKGTDLNTAMAASAIPSTIMQYKVFWNQDDKKVGFKIGAQIIGAVLGPLKLYSCSTNAPFADTVIKAAAIFAIVSGSYQIFFPEKSAEAYGIELTPENVQNFQTLGWLLLGLGIFQSLSVFTDTSPIQAFGYSWIPALLMQLSNVFINKAATNKFLSYFWILVDIMMVTVCGFEGLTGNEHHNIQTTI
jgi:hypothetical protein